ncbi:MAG: peptide chain release factor N(5)-glutamine methyltransferase [Chitinispirillaceae bacterium]|nr:peptide chain release factor N(5)-glutamine methyltransferase [Chitinispirillaceae bacterium]
MNRGFDQKRSAPTASGQQQTLIMRPLSELMRETVAKLTGVLGKHALPHTERIFEHLLCCSHTDLYLDGHRNVDSVLTDRLDAIVCRCLDCEPLDYILGTTYFFDREFIVAPVVLVPRPDTERLVEQVLCHEKARQLCFADIGTGSGIIACILTEQRPQWNGVGIDVSPRALSVARRNVRSEGIGLVCSDLFRAFRALRRFDFIVGNPPYIKSGDIGGLDESIHRFEPLIALDGGNDGLAFFRRLAREAPAHLKAGGSLYCEIGYDQEDAVRSIFSAPPWDRFRCFRDLAGNPRVIIVCNRG